MDARVARGRAAGATVLLVPVLLLPSEAAAQWALHAYGGASFSRRADLHIVQPRRATDLVFKEVPWRNEPFRDPPYYGLELSYAPRGPWVFALDFTHLKIFARTDARLLVSGEREGVPIAARERLGDSVKRFSVSHGVNLLTANAGRKWQLARCWELWTLLGVGASLSHPESDLAGLEDEHYEWDGPAAQARLEARWRVGRRWAVAGGYKLSYVSLDERIPEGRARLGLRTHHLIAGLAFVF